MDMKKILIALASIALGLASTGCDSYFDINLKDQPTLDDTMSRIAATRRYLAHLYSYIPYDERIREDDGGTVGRSDEMLMGSSQYETYWYYVRRGDYSSVYNLGKVSISNSWSKYYIAINQCTTFIENVKAEGVSAGESSLRTVMEAEARALRAYYYFILLRQYGPVVIWGDKPADMNVDPSTLDRNTLQENLDFITGELRKAIEVLPVSLADIQQPLTSNMGRINKGAAMAILSRVLQYAASPLYNGQNGTGIYNSLTNSKGEKLFPDYSADRWTEAAAAAKAVIDLGIYQLVTESNKSRTDFQNAQGSWQNVWFQSWESNPETIWGWWYRTQDDGYLGSVGVQIGYSAPRIISLEGYSLLTPSLKLVDAYPMWETGRYPVLGYAKSNGLLDYSRPIIDPASGYRNEGFTENYVQPLDFELYKNGKYPSWAKPIKAHNSTIGRDPRYYACLVPNGYWWPSESTHAGPAMLFTCYNSDEATVKWMSEGQVNRVGYSWRRLYKANNPLHVSSDYNSIRYVYPAFRLAEIYFNYAEACNEMPQRNAAEAIRYLDLIRARSGLPGIRDAYPEIDFENADGTTTIAGITRTGREWLRWFILHEKMVEMCFEGQRHYDCNRWMRAEEEYNTENWTLHVKAVTYEESYERVNDDYMGGRSRFQSRDYLFPFSSSQIAEMTNFTQNPGW